MVRGSSAAWEESDSVNLLSPHCGERAEVHRRFELIRRPLKVAARSSARDLHQAKHFGLSLPAHSTRLDGLWLADCLPAHRSAIMAPIQSTEFDLAKCLKGEQQLVYVYHDQHRAMRRELMGAEPGTSHIEHSANPKPPRGAKPYATFSPRKRTRRFSVGPGNPSQAHRRRKRPSSSPRLRQ